MPLSPSSPLFASLCAAHPCLSPLVFISAVSPRLPFPSTIWTLIPPLLTTSAHVFLVDVVLGHGWCEFFPCPPFFVLGVLLHVSFAHFLSASLFFFFLGIACPSTVVYPSVSTGAAVGALGRGVSWVSRLAGGGVGFAEVEAVASWRGGYLIMRASSASWVVEVAWHECIRLCSSDASCFCWVAGCLFVGIVGPLSCPLVHRFLLPGGLQTASRMS
jgi:hypothetical protein